MYTDTEAIIDRYLADISGLRAESIRALAEAVRDGEIAPCPINLYWEICDYCHGDGGHSRRFGSYTHEEFEEMSEEFQEGYLSGKYDERCEVCNGSGKVREIDMDDLSDEAREYIESYETAARDHYAEIAAERRAGA